MSEATRIEGKVFSSQLREKVAGHVAWLQKEHGITPGLAVVLVGDDPASEVYVRNKGIATREAGMNSIEFRLPADATEEEVLDRVRALNADEDVHGVLVQFPVPDQISQQTVIDTIDPAKDVDGLHPLNAGRLSSGLPGLVSCTPLGCLIMARASVEGGLSGKHAVVLGRSNLVGKPVAQLLLNENCTVTIAHSRTENLPEIIGQADVLVAAVGRPKMVEGSWIKEGAVVIDVGINRVPAPDKGEGKTRLVGDVDYQAALSRASAITPVPGGVGLMTVACLIRNTVVAAFMQNGIEPPADL